MHTTCVIIGAGHSGLAMSHCLTERSIDHVILERGEIANSWKRERWDSLRLLTPNWQAQLPGFGYYGDDPDGFMTMPETIGFIEEYANLISAPVRDHNTVTSVAFDGGNYKVTTNQEEWTCRTVVVASGACNLPNIPALAESIPNSISMLTPITYRNPGQLETGGVLVVGASASGIQIAAEIHRSGRPVTLALGEHVRLPRSYRGRDIQWWMDTAGILDERYDEIEDINRARNLPSPQLIGSPDHSTLDLNKLTELGVTLRGRIVGISDGKAQFSGSLRNVCALADLKMGRLLDTIDEWATANDLDATVPPTQRYAPTLVEESPPLMIDLAKSGIKTILWATGYHPDYSWLELPIIDRKGKIRHDGGVVQSPGMYLLGMSCLRRRKSSFIHGAEDDVRDLSERMAWYLSQ